MKLMLAPVALAASLLVPLSAQAVEFTTLSDLTQSEFNQLTKDLGAAASYKALASATPLGITGFDVAVHSAFTSIEYGSIWSKAAGGADLPGTIPVPGIRIAKGLPFGIDIGATLTAVPKVSGRLAGVELRWAIVDGGLVTPAIGVRVAATQLSGVDQLRLNTTLAEVSISKGFAIITPYAGAGIVGTSAKAKGVSSLDSESVTQSRVFVGGHLNLGLFDITLEADRTGKTSSVSTRLGFRF